MATKPVEYRMDVRGFGTWRIAYDVGARQWRLAYNVRARGEQWVLVGGFSIAEAAAVAVEERRTGTASWDGLGFGHGMCFDLSVWVTDVSEGVQEDVI